MSLGTLPDGGLDSWTVGAGDVLTDEGGHGEPQVDEAVTTAEHAS